MAAGDYYDLLSVSRDASEADIKSAYKKAARKYHPDNTETGSEEKFKQVGEAYDALKDPQKRSLYDQYGAEGLKAGAGGFGGHGGFHGQGFEDLSDVFSNFFGAGFAGAGRRSNRANYPERGRDHELAIKLGFLDPLAEIKKKIRINPLINCTDCNGVGAKNPSADMQTCPSCNGHGEVVAVQNSILGQIRHSQTCPTCKGKGKIIKNPCTSCKGRGQQREEKEVEIKIPAGVEDSSHLRLHGMGDAGKHGGPSGDIYVILQIAKDPRFERHGADIYTELKIDYTDAALGEKLEIETVAGKTELEIKAGTQFGQVYTIKNKGMPKLNRNGQHGDHFVKIKIETPTKLSGEEKELLKQLKSRRR